MVPTETEGDRAVHIRPHPGEAAFPYVTPGIADYSVCPGLTKREYFAALAMRGLINACDPDDRDDIVERAVKFADALFEELNPFYS